MDERAAINNAEHDDLASGCIRLEICEKDLGFGSSPPGMVELKFFEVGGRWTAFVLTEPGELVVIARWLNTQLTGACYPAPAAEPCVMRAVFEEFPRPLDRFLRAVEVKNISMRPAGGATVFTKEPPEYLRVMVKSTLGVLGDVDIRLPGALRAREEDALAHAVTMGYYDDPPACLVGAVAERMGIEEQEVARLLHEGATRLVGEYSVAAIDGKWDAARDQLNKLRAHALNPMIP